jgi:hypothetical protein
VCDPTDKVVVVPLMALPLAFSVTALPKFEPSIANCTVPAGVPNPSPNCCGVTVAVKFTPSPNTDGFALEVTVVTVTALNALSVAGVVVLLLA